MRSKCQMTLWNSMGAEKERLHAFYGITTCSSFTTASMYRPRPVLKKGWTVQRVASLEADRTALLVTPRCIKQKIKQKKKNPEFLLNKYMQWEKKNVHPKTLCLSNISALCPLYFHPFHSPSITILEKS